MDLMFSGDFPSADALTLPFPPLEAALMKTRLVYIFAAAAIALTACEHPCLTLAKKVCNCEEVASDAEDCKSRVTAEKNNIDISDSQKAFCEAKLDTCTCKDLNTPIGQAKCGLAYEPNSSLNELQDSSLPDSGISGEESTAPSGADAGDGNDAAAPEAP